MSIFLPQRSLYDTLSFSAQVKESKRSVTGQLYEIGRIGVGLQKYIQVRLKDQRINPELRSKTYIGKIDKDQLEDYAKRKGMSLDEMTRWLRPVLE